MDNQIQTILELLLGISLSAAAGFRLFVPPLMLSIAAVYGHLQLSPDFQWAGSQPAVIVLAIATVVEILAYYIPFLDHALDVVQLPMTVAIGTMLTANSLGDLDPVLQWTIAVIAGGGAASAIKSATSLTRVSFTGLTGGLGNFILSTIEAITAVALSVTAIVNPVVAIIILTLIVGFIIYLIWNYFFKKPQKPSSPPNFG